VEIGADVEELSGSGAGEAGGQEMAEPSTPMPVFDEERTQPNREGAEAAAENERARRPQRRADADDDSPTRRGQRDDDDAVEPRAAASEALDDVRLPDRPEAIAASPDAAKDAARSLRPSELALILGKAPRVRLIAAVAGAVAALAALVYYLTRL
jgi:hypothetical protein